MSMNYKVLTSAICIILALLMLAGCKSPSTPNTDDETTPDKKTPDIVYDDNPVSYNTAKTDHILQYSGGFFYFLSYETGNGKRLMRNTDIFKYNPKTGLLTYVCKDPVCDHKTPDCPLFGHMTMFFYKDRLFFNKNYKYAYQNRETEIFMGFASYDTVSGELNKLQVDAFEVAEKPTVKFAGELASHALFFDNYRFYYEVDYNEELDSDVRMLKRMNIDTGEVTILDNSSNTANGQSTSTLSYLFCVDGRLYLSDMKSLYSTNLDYKDKKIIAESVFGEETVTNGKVIVWRNSDTHELYAMNMDGTNSRSLGIKASSFKLNEKSLYYFSDEEIELGTASETGKPEIITNFELYRYSFETEKSEQLLDLRSDDGCITTSSWEVVNNCLYGRYRKWTYPKTGERFSYERHRYSGTDTEHVNTILRVDLATGEQSFIELAVN